MIRFIERCRELSMRTAVTILGISVSSLLAEGLVVCSLGFQPGWANGWPGASKHSVFAAFLSGALFLMLVSVGAAVFAVPCSLLQRLIKREYVGWGAFASLMLAWAVLATILSAGAFPALRASILKEWP
jgi:hypothetical protein